MLKNKKLARHITDQRWGRTKIQLKYKVESTGGQFIEVPVPYTSQTCSVCDFVDRRNRKRGVFICLSCGHTAHADTCNSENTMLSGKAKLEFPMQAVNIIKSKEDRELRGTLLAEQYVGC